MRFRRLAIAGAIALSSCSQPKSTPKAPLIEIPQASDLKQTSIIAPRREQSCSLILKYGDDSMPQFHLYDYAKQDVVTIIFDFIGKTPENQEGIYFHFFESKMGDSGDLRQFQEGYQFFVPFGQKVKFSDVLYESHFGQSHDANFALFDVRKLPSDSINLNFQFHVASVTVLTFDYKLLANGILYIGDTVPGFGEIVRITGNQISFSNNTSVASEGCTSFGELFDHITFCATPSRRLNSNPNSPTLAPTFKLYEVKATDIRE